MTSNTQQTDDGKPLRPSEVDKRLLERDAARLFMRRYEYEFGQPMRHIWHNEPAKPDVSCYFQEQPLDLEIAHLYANENEAKCIAPRANDDPLWCHLQALTHIPPEQQVDEALQRILSSKAAKHYHSEQVWLVIRNASPHWQRQDFLLALEDIVIPPHSFEQIWLLPDFAGQQVLVRIA